jgi:hypothetical protein
MFWKVLLAAAVAIGLVQLGALYVWVSVLKATLAERVNDFETPG